MRTRTFAARRSFRAVATAIVLTTAVVLPLTPLAPSAASASATSTAPQPVASPEPTATPEPAVAPVATEPTATPAPSATPEPAIEPSPSATPAPTAVPAAPTPSAAPTPAPVTAPARAAAVVAPMAVGGPETTIAPPYVHWAVKDANGVPIAGATMQLQSARYTWGLFSGYRFRDWSTTPMTVVDCIAATAAQCTGADKDPNPGEFQVTAVSVYSNRNDITRYRISMVTPPTGYTYPGGASAWVEMPENSWPSDDRYGFADLVLVKDSDDVLCTSGYFYAVTGDGIVRQVYRGSASTAVSTLGRWSGVTEVNGLAVAAGGSAIYAHTRAGSGSQNVGSILRYTAAGGWVVLPSTGYTTGNTVALVAGAMNPANGRYYFGGFSSFNQRTVFRLHSYDPATGVRALAGWVDTGLPSGEAASSNGDIAFGADGTLHVIRSSGSSITSFTVTSAALAAAAGGEMIASASAPAAISNFTNINGVAFDSDGTIYLGSGTSARRFDPATWQQIGSGDLTSGLAVGGATSTDLASCASPATVTIVKHVVNRVNPTDQFRLQLLPSASQTVIAEATTTGTAAGRQAAQVGPVPVITGSTYRIREQMASGAASGYASSYACRDELGTLVSNGTGTEGQLAITRAGANIVCTFTNSPLVTTVSVTKLTTAADGQQVQAGVGWQVTAAVRSTTGTVTPPSPATKTTAADGTATWTVPFGSLAARASMTISETQRAGWVFSSGECVLTAIDGTETTHIIQSAGGVTLANVAPGSTVECTFINRELPTTLTLANTIGFGDAGLASQWQLRGTGPQSALPGPAGATGTASATARVTPSVAYALSHSGGPASYAQVGSWACRDQSGAIVPVTASGVSLVKGTQVTCTVTNSTARLTLLKHIDATAGGTLRADMFTLTATPASLAGLTATSTRGSETEIASGADANRFDVRPGHSYTLTERSDYASLGLRLERRTGQDAWVTVTDPTIQVPAGEHHVYRFVNAPVPALALPLTGGIGADTYVMGGGALLLLALAFIIFRSRRSAQRDPGLVERPTAKTPSISLLLARIQKGTAPMATIKKSRAARITAGLGAAAIATVTILSGALPASAAPNIDTNRQGSIVIHKYEQPATALPTSTGSPLSAADLAGQAPINGVRFQIRQIGTFDVRDNADWAGLPAMSASDIVANPDNYSLGEARQLTTATHATLGAGVAQFGSLPLGAYIVQELGLPTVTNGSSNVVIPGAPFIVAVPQAENNTWQYDVHVYPKNSVIGASKEVSGYAPQGLGSKLTWTIRSSAPIASQNTSLTSYAIEDALDPTLDYVEGSATVSVAGTALASTAFSVTAPATAGGTVTVTFEGAGVSALRANPGAAVVVTIDTTVVAMTSNGKVANTGRVVVNGNGVVTSNQVVENWGGIEILKTDATATATPLQGAVFSVYATTDTGFANPLAINGVTEFTSGADGIVTIHGLRTNVDGSAQYVVREERAPSGFQIGSTSSWTVDVPVGTNEDIELTVTNAQVPAYTLPITGGAGQAAFMIGGAGLILGGLGFVLLRRRKTQAENQA